MHINDIRVGRRLAGGFGILVFLILGVGLLGVWVTWDLSHKMDIVGSERVPDLVAIA